jgi:lysozyme family protein
MWRRVAALAVVGFVCGFLIEAQLNAVPSSWPSVLANILVSEGGNVDDPADPGGRTSRGIIQREWDAWRVTHRGLPLDVWDAPQAEIDAIYERKYWLHRCVRGDMLPAGLDYSLSDYGVNSGVDRAGKVLRKLLGQDASHCEMTDGLLALIRTKDPEKAIRAVNTERRQFLERLIVARPQLAKFRNGWMKRVDAVEKISLKRAGVPVLGLFGQEEDVEPAFGPGKAWVQ